MNTSDGRPVTPSEQRRIEWTKRVDSFARDAAPKTRPYAEALVAMATPIPGARVLDVASGTGIAAVEAGKLVGPAGSVLATDFVSEWEPYVVAAAAEAGLTNVTFATMPAEALELPDESFDLVLCQFGLMFVADPLQTLRELRRVLRLGGTLAIAVWSVPEKVGLFLFSGIVMAALPAPAGDSPPSPMGLGAPGLLEGLVDQAGLGDITVQRVTRAFEIASAEDEWRNWSESGSPFAERLAALPAAELERIHDQAMFALERFRDGAILRIASEAILVTAIR